MKKRNIPCTECRHLRRKCVFAPQSSDCIRCVKRQKLCVPISNDVLEETNTEDGNFEIDEWKDQIESLESAIAQIQLELNRLRNHRGSTALINRNNHNYGYYTQAVLEAMIRSLAFNWEVKIKNGAFQIDTGIRNIHDLLQCQFDCIHYLSPISNMSSLDENPELYRGKSDALIQFGQQIKEGCYLMPFTVKLLTLCAKKNHKVPDTISLPSRFLLDFRTVIDRIIQVYFQCHNTYAPLVHEKMFMNHYRQVRDPLSDPLTLSICSHVCSTPCDHLHYNVRESRSMSDFFFLKAKSIIMEQFDEREKRLENVICINLLAKHMRVTMKFMECRKFIMMAYQICLDLKDEYPSEISSDYIYQFGFAEDDIDVYKKRLEHVLYSRHIAATLCVRRLMDFIADRAINDSSFHFPMWLYMSDEPEQLKRFVQSQNWVMSMFNDPFVGNVMKQILKIHLGKKCSLTFESIVRLEDIFDEWFKSMPAEFCITKNFKDETKCKEAIDQCSDCTILFTFINFHLFIIGIYSSLLQPIALGENNDLLLPLVQKTSLEHTLKACRILLHLLLRIFQMEGDGKCQYTLAACESLFRVIDSLLILSLSKNELIATESKNILRTCLNELDKIDFIQEHRVPVFNSPIHLGLMNIDNPESFHLDYYDQCPNPWFAMVYDASHFVAFSS